MFLDANENPYGEYNRYPDAFQRKLKEKIAEIKNLDASNLFLGNGSDEVIDLLFRIFCKPGLDKVITCPPTYGMYQVSADINDIEVLDVQLNSDFQPDVKSIINTAESDNVKMLFICSPNNPTGNAINSAHIKLLLNSFQGIVVVDEAYSDFSSEPSCTQYLADHENLVVLQTLSKAYGMAGLRIGLCWSSGEITGLLNKVKPPYNISRVNQDAALELLDNIKEYEARLNLIMNEKVRLKKELERIRVINKIYPSEANFLLVEVENADRIYNELQNRGVIIRNRNSKVPDCVRITIGTPEENDELLKCLSKI